MRIPASFCGVIGFRPSHGAVSTIGVLPNSQSLDAVGMSETQFFLPSFTSSTKVLFIFSSFPFFGLFYFDLVGFFAHDPSVLHRVGHALLQLNSVEPKRTRRIIFADDLFQISKLPTQRTVHILSKVIEGLSGCKLKHFLIRTKHDLIFSFFGFLRFFIYLLFFAVIKNNNNNKCWYFR